MNGFEFRAWRQRLGLTQTQLADRLGVTQRTIASWETADITISRQTEMAMWAIEQRLQLEQQLEMFESGRMTTGEKRRQGNGWIDVDTTAEAIDRVRAHIAQLDAVAAVERRGYGAKFDVGQPQLSTNGYCISIRNAHKGPIAAIEYRSIEEAQAAAEALRAAIEPAIAVTDTRGKTW
jgi:transcriptional regulator with XRE-family HTH domain